MARMITKKFGTPDETRPFASKGFAEILRFEEGVVGRGVFEPGWKWSECVKPIAGTASCEAQHAGFVVSGRMRIRMNDGQEMDIGPGDIAMIPPGHDAWVVGNETCVILDFAGMETYAQPSAGAGRPAGAEPSQPAVH
jgi:hypothetical protein